VSNPQPHSQTESGEDKRPPVIVISGPTAAGKSSLALELAEQFSGEIVNADSVQVYRGLDVGSAKPSLEERARVPHHLVDVVDPSVVYDAGLFMKDARAAIDAIHQRGNLPFLVGGTGLYIRAALEGLIDGGAADEEFRERMEIEHKQALAEGDPLRLHRQLEELDAHAAKRIHPNDLRRTIRALEINQRSGLVASKLQENHSFQDRPYRVLQIALDPGVEALVERIDLRCQQMIDQGLLQEVRQLRKQGVGPELRSMSAIGYRHMAPVVEGTETLTGALLQMQRDTRHFAKRQRTWLRKVEGIHWVDPKEKERVQELVQVFLTAETKP